MLEIGMILKLITKNNKKTGQVFIFGIKKKTNFKTKGYIIYFGIRNPKESKEMKKIKKALKKAQKNYLADEREK